MGTTWTAHDLESSSADLTACSGCHLLEAGDISKRT